MTPLHQTPQWLLVKLVPAANGKTDKLPCNYITGEPCNAHEPQNWTTYDAAVALAQARGQGWTVGFVITAADPFFCLDIDGALQADGTWSPLAQRLVALLPGCSTEISQSGRGLHIWGRYPNPPAHIKKRVDLHIELYTELRFIAIGHSAVGAMADRCDALPAVLAEYFPPRETAQAHGDGPRPDWRGPTDDDDLLRRMLRSQSAGAAFGGKASAADLWTKNLDVLRRCYAGDGDDGIDWSSVDAALAQHLAFWTGCDQDRMISLMRQSQLVREKWDTREDYLPRTVASACGMQRDVLQDKPVVPPSAVPAPLAVVTPPPVPDDAAPEPAADMPVTMGAREGRPYITPDQLPTLFKGCIFVAEMHRVLAQGGKLYKPETFNAVYGGHTFVMDGRSEKTTRKAFEAFTENQVVRPTVVDGLCFRPDLPYGTVIDTEGRQRANSYWPARVRRLAGDVGPFLRHLELVLPNEEDRRILVYYLANCIQNAGHKAQWFPLLVGTEGNGKSFFSRVLTYCVGQRYSHWADASKLGNQFNGWIFGKLVIAIEDLKIGDSLEVWEKLKPMITGENIEVEGKGVDQRTDEICANFIANSNHKTAIRATMNDRRVCHLWTAQEKEADVFSAGMGQEYMSRLYDWAKADGYAIVAEFLHTLKIPEEYGLKWFKGRAPKSSSHRRALDASLGPIEQEILEAVEREQTGFRGGWISSGYLDELLRRGGRERQVPPNRRREMLQNLGYDWHPGLLSTQGRVHNAVLPDAAKVKLYVLAGSPAAEFRGTPAEVASAYAKAQGVAK